MADTKISALTALTLPVTGDIVPIVDVSDTTQAASGTTKGITFSTFVDAVLSAVEFGSSAAAYLIAGASAMDFRGRTASTVTPEANDGVAGFIGPTMTVTEASSGTHPIITSWAVKAPAITNGTAATTLATTLWVEGEPTGTASPTTKSALHVASGRSRFGGAIVPLSVVALTDGATPALDASLGNIFYLDAAGNRTIAVPTNPTDGQKIVIRHFANGGARTLALNTGAGGFRFGTDITALSATGSGLMDYIGCIYNGVDGFWDVVSVIKGF